MHADGPVVPSAVDPIGTRRRSWRYVVGGLLVVLVVGVEAFLVQAYRETEKTTAGFSTASTVTTFLANIQREAIMLQAEAERLDRTEDLDALKLRRMILARQLTVARNYLDPSIASAVQRIDALVARFDDAVRALGDRPSTEIIRHHTTALVAPLRDLELEVKAVYDREDVAFNDITLRTLRARAANQRLLLAMGAVIFILGGALALSFHLDLTERRRAAEAAFEAKREAERASSAKSEFLSRMSHELRTPLNAILGFAQVLEMDGLTTEQQESNQHVLRAGRHLLGLIDELLDIARIEDGHVALSLEPVCVLEVLTEVRDLIVPMATTRRVVLWTQPPEHSDVDILADKQRLKQVLLNLVSNAVKYNRAGGSVRIECEPSSIGRLRIMVSDDGVGIPAEKMDKLFTPFERLGAEATEIEGTGIGLAVSKRLTELMGGTIGASSEPGRGSTFWVELPIAAARAVRAESPREEQAVITAPVETERTVLYIEDNLSNLRLIERLLTRRPGVRLVPAMQGHIGFDLARDHLPDLILLDLQLPDVSGRDVLYRLRESSHTLGIPVVIMSADASPRTREELLSVGASGFLTKPVDVKRFFEIIDQFLAAERLAGATPASFG